MTVGLTDDLNPSDAPRGSVPMAPATVSDASGLVKRFSIATTLASPVSSPLRALCFSYPNCDHASDDFVALAVDFWAFQSLADLIA